MTAPVLSYSPEMLFALGKAHGDCCRQAITDTEHLPFVTLHLAREEAKLATHFALLALRARQGWDDHFPVDVRTHRCYCQEER